MIKIDLEVIDNFFIDLMEILSESEVDKSSVFVAYGKLSVAIHTYKDQLTSQTKGNKAKKLKNQKTINMLEKVEKAMTAKMNSPLNEINLRVTDGYEIFSEYY